MIKMTDRQTDNDRLMSVNIDHSFLLSFCLLMLRKYYEQLSLQFFVKEARVYRKNT